MQTHYTLSKLFCITIVITACFSCQKEPIDVGEDTTEIYSDTTAVRSAVHSLYMKGVPAFLLATDQDLGIPSAWGSYLSGLFESEADQGFYPPLAGSDVSSPAVNELARQIYTTCFDGIEAADTVIIRIPGTPGLKPAEQAVLLGEAKFFRAFNRLYLIRTFGSFPTSRLESSFLTPEAAYARVEKDLLDAVATLSEKSFAENASRVTAFAARAMLGEVYLLMSGKPLQKDRYGQAAEILRPIVKAEKHRLAGREPREEMSAFNMLRTTPAHEEYLFTVYGESTLPRSSFSFPKKGRNWEMVKEHVAFNAFKPTRSFMACYADDDLRGKDHQFFHTFFKVKDEGKTVFEIFDPAPYFWLSAGVDAPASSMQSVGVYRYAEVLLMLAESIVCSEGVTNEAVYCLSQVRARSVSTPQAELEQYLSALTADRLLAEIFLERLRELPYEMKHLSDILRTDLYPMARKDTILFTPLPEAKTPRGNRPDRSNLILPRPAL